jgi:hypothetical protein
MGSVLGRSIAAHTTVPGPLLVREPAGDTLRLSIADDESGRRIAVPYAWHAAGATNYQSITTDPLTQNTRTRFHHDTSGVLYADIAFFIGQYRTTLFQVLALDTAEGGFLSNITGALGRFGSASVMDPPKVILWQ